MESMKQHDELKDIIQSEGLLKASPHFTENVMTLVEMTGQKADISYKPLLSKTAWIIIVSSMFTLLLVSWLIIPAGEQTFSFNTGFMDQISVFIRSIDLNIHINSQIMTLLTLLAGCIGFFVILDILLMRRRQDMVL